MQEVILVLQEKPFKWQLDQESNQLIYSNYDNKVSASIYTVENFLKKSTEHISFPSFQITLTANQLIIKNAHSFLSVFDSTFSTETDTIVNITRSNSSATILTQYRTKSEINNFLSSPNLRANTKITSAQQRSISFAVKTNWRELDDAIDALISEQKKEPAKSRLKIEMNTDSNTVTTSSNSARTDTISAEPTDIFKEKLDISVDNEIIEKELKSLSEPSIRNYLSLDYLFKFEDDSVKTSIFSYRRLLVQAEAEINYLQNQLYLTYFDLEKLAALRNSYEKQNQFKAFFERIEYWLNSFSEKSFKEKALLVYLREKLKILCDEKILYSILFKSDKHDNLNKFSHAYNNLQYEIIEEKFGNSCIVNQRFFNKRFKDIYNFITNFSTSEKYETQFLANDNITFAEQLGYVSVNMAFNTHLFSKLTKSRSRQALVKDYLSSCYQSIGAKQKQIDKNNYYIPQKLKSLFYTTAEETLSQTGNRCATSTRKTILEKNRKLIITNWLQKYTKSISANKFEAENFYILSKKK